MRIITARIGDCCVGLDYSLTDQAGFRVGEDLYCVVGVGEGGLWLRGPMCDPYIATMAALREPGGTVVCVKVGMPSPGVSLAKLCDPRALHDFVVKGGGVAVAQPVYGAAGDRQRCQAPAADLRSQTPLARSAVVGACEGVSLRAVLVGDRAPRWARLMELLGYQTEIVPVEEPERAVQ
ncbi:MAG: hypothetical protein HYU66_11650 [Armatimonadetes bacterium]|nr:hypothetical protein [Armatimonadota bacterium]